MTRLTLVAFPGNETLADQLARPLGAGRALLEVHAFPDQETAVRLSGAVDGDLAFVCSLERPNGKFLPLVFAARTARELGAQRIGLIAPYLAYMRQDSRFVEGAALSARLFADEISRTFDWIVTVDPHLHRIASLADIFAIPSEAVHAAPALAAWVRKHVDKPIIVGPDGESGQWVSEVARLCDAPFMTFTKVRIADEKVTLSARETAAKDRVPVIVDDIISSGQTMAQAVRAATDTGHAKPWCVGIHAVFAPGADDLLAAAGPVGIVTTNTIVHPSNAIDISALLAAAVGRLAHSGQGA